MLHGVHKDFTFTFFMLFLLFIFIGSSNNNSSSTVLAAVGVRGVEVVVVVTDSVLKSPSQEANSRSAAQFSQHFIHRCSVPCSQNASKHESLNNVL